jgi:N-formylglutamate amidohydrolase
MPRLAFLLLGPTLALLPGVRARDDSPARPEDLVFVQKGTLPIIISAPHGGRKEIPGVPVRTDTSVANFATAFDANTLELTELFAKELEKKLDGKPWLVVAHFSRKHLDANRPRDGAYESEKAKPYYDRYHGSLEAACKAVKQKFGRGLLLDIHGQGAFNYAICRGTQNGKTVKVLKERFGWTAVTGKESVLGQLQGRGYKILPDCDADEKAKEEPKFNGGHIVQTYGSHTGFAIDAIQLEFGMALRERKPDRLAKTAKDLAEAVEAFHDAYLKNAK